MPPRDALLRSFRRPRRGTAPRDGTRLAHRGIDGSARLLDIASGSADGLPNLGGQRDLFTALG